MKLKLDVQVEPWRKQELQQQENERARSVADTSRRRGGSTRGRAANSGRERTREEVEVIQKMLPPGKRVREDDDQADSFGDNAGAAKHRFRDLHVHGDK